MALTSHLDLSTFPRGCFVTCRSPLIEAAPSHSRVLVLRPRLITLPRLGLFFEQAKPIHLAVAKDKREVMLEPLRGMQLPLALRLTTVIGHRSLSLYLK